MPLKVAMVKKKTHKASVKRFRVTATGLLKRSCAGKKHLNSHKSKKRKRQLRSGGSSLVHESDVHRLDQLLPNS